MNLKLVQFFYVVNSGSIASFCPRAKATGYIIYKLLQGSKRGFTNYLGIKMLSLLSLIKLRSTDLKDLFENKSPLITPNITANV